MSLNPSIVLADGATCQGTQSSSRVLCVGNGNDAFKEKNGQIYRSLQSQSIIIESMT